MYCYCGQQHGSKLVGGSNCKFIAGSGNDSIINGFGYDPVNNIGGNKVTINAGDGNNTVRSFLGSGVQITTGKDADSIENFSSKTKIIAGAGNDTVTNSGNKVKIDSGENDDHIYNFGKKVTVTAGEGDDHVGNNNSSVTIDAGTGDDSIYNAGNSVSIKATEDDTGDTFTTKAPKLQSRRARAMTLSITGIPTPNIKASPSRLTRATATIKLISTAATISPSRQASMTIQLFPPSLRESFMTLQSTRARVKIS